MSLIPDKLSNDKFYAPHVLGVILAIQQNPWLKYMTQDEMIEKLIRDYGPFADVDDDYIGIFGQFHPKLIDGYDYAAACVACDILKREIIANDKGSCRSIRHLISRNQEIYEPDDVFEGWEASG